ncbi:MAG: cytochrome P450 [Pseudomonadota bacterium]|nr:cytochrome P450 [Pseudomonadota bacterium]
MTPVETTVRPPVLATLPVLTYGTAEFREHSIRILAEASARGPLCRVLPHDVLGVTRFAEVDAILRDPRTFSSTVEILIQPTGIAPIGSLIADDPPTHTRLRALLAQVFSPARIATVMEPRVLAIGRALVDQVLARGREFDLVRDLAVPFPVHVISELLGVDAADLPRFTRWSEDITGASLASVMPEGPERTRRLASLDQSLREMDAYLAGAAAEYRKHPAENLLSFMIQASEGEDRLTEAEVLSLAKLLLVAGNETTTKLIGLAMNHLLRSPPAWQDLRAAPGLIPGAMEESVRIEGPVPHRLRRATRDCVIAGMPVAAGALVDCVIGAANLDATVFPDPTRYDLRRVIPRHLGFGTGIHQCLGIALARLEVRIVYEELAAHMREITAAGPATRGTISAFRGFESMPLRYELDDRRPARAPILPPPDVALAELIAKKSDTQLGLDKRAREIVRVARVREIAEGIKLFRLVHPFGGLLTHFTAGSHVILHLRDGDKVYRNAYSLLNADFGNGLNYFIAVARDEDGRGGSRYMHDKVTAGMELSVSVPANNFPAAPHAGKHLLVAGGIGITPLFAIRNHLRAAREPYELHYTFRAAARAAFVEELELETDPAVRLYDNALGRHLDVEALIRSQPEGTHVYVCGPEGLMDAVIEAASRHHWPEGCVHYERFGALRPRHERPFEVACRRSGESLVCSGEETLLEALERSGLTLPYACRAGSCGACETFVLEGEVDHRDTVLTDAEKAEGKMLPCVSRGRGRLVLLV